jgi:hypothetical protein
MRRRIAFSAAIGLSSGLCCWIVLHHLRLGAADFQWAIRGAQHLLQRTNPYGTPLEQYPMTAALFALPFVQLPGDVAAGIFFGISSGLLAFGLTSEGYTRLWIFLAYPYWAAMLTAQWSPLIAASAFLPLLLPATLAKPQVGFPVALTRLTRRGAIACAVWCAVSLAVMPRWLILWIKQFGNYQHFFPLLVFPGPLLLLALFRYRKQDCWLLLLSAAMPARWFFDAFILWLIPKSRKEILVTAAFSWGAGIWRWYHYPTSFNQVGRWAVFFFYLPMMAVVLLRKSAVGENEKMEVAVHGH